MKPPYFLHTPEGREGPYSEEDLLDLLDQNLVPLHTECEDAAGQRAPVGEMFERIEPESGAGIPATPSSRAETALYLGRPSWLAYWKSWLAVALLVLCALKAPWFRIAGDRAESAAGFPAAWFVLAVLVLSIILRRGRSTYVVTSRRVEALTGLISRNSSEVRIRDIRAMNVRKFGLLGICGVGTIEFSSAANEDVEVVFTDAAGVDRIKLLVRAAGEMA